MSTLYMVNTRRQIKIFRGIVLYNMAFQGNSIRELTNADLFHCMTFSLMVISLIHPHTCGFAKVIPSQLTKVTQKETENERWRTSQVSFAFNGWTSQAFPLVPSANARIILPLILSVSTRNSLTFSRNSYVGIRARSKSAQTYLTTFNVDTWKMLSSSKKAEHSLMECHGCAHRNRKHGKVIVSRKVKAIKKLTSR